MYCLKIRPKSIWIHSGCQTLARNCDQLCLWFLF